MTLVKLPQNFAASGLHTAFGLPLAIYPAQLYRQTAKELLQSARIDGANHLPSLRN